MTKDRELNADDYIDIAHESLIKNWRVLGEKWLLEEEQQAKALIELLERARGWRAEKRGLLVGLDLKAAREWDAVRNHSPRWAEHYVGAGAIQEVEVFLSASDKAFEESERKEKERRERELEQEQNRRITELKLEAQQSSARRTKVFAIALAALLVAALVLAYKVWKETQNARNQQRLAESRELAAKAVEDLFLDPMSGIQKSVRASELARTKEADDSLERAFEQSSVQAVLRDPNNAPLSGAAFSPDGKWVLTTNYWGKAWLWEVADFAARPHGPLSNDQLLHISADSFSPDSERVLLSSGFGGTPSRSLALLWNIADGITTTPAVSLPASSVGPITSASFSPTGRYVVTAGEDYSAIVWDARTLRVLDVPFNRQSGKHSDIINSAHFSRDERRVVTASQDGRAKVWDINSGAMIPLRKFTFALFSAEFSPADSNLVVTGGQDREVTLWNVRLRKLRVLGMHIADVREAAFNRTGDRIVSASLDGTAKVWAVPAWDVSSPDQSPFLTLRGHQGGVTGAGFGPKGDLIVTASLDGTARVWRVEIPPQNYSHQEKLHYLKQLTERSKLQR